MSKRNKKDSFSTVKADIYRMDAAMRPKGAVRKAVGGVRKFANMCWDKTYRTTWLTKLTAFGAFAYLLVPADLIPDVIPLLGLVDDIAILGLMVAQFRQELVRYDAHLAGGKRITKRAVKKSAYQRAVAEVEITAPTPSPVGKTLGPAYARIP